LNTGLTVVEKKEVRESQTEKERERERERENE
jgi:hypothetical protein